MSAGRRAAGAWRWDQRIRSPLIDPNYLAESADVTATAAGFRQARTILGTEPLSPLLTACRVPEERLQSDAELEQFLRERSSSTCYHPVGTCKMGIDEMAVVDPQLRVRGLEGLRVADASIMPTLISGNTNADADDRGESCGDDRGRRRSVRPAVIRPAGASLASARRSSRVAEIGELTRGF